MRMIMIMLMAMVWGALELRCVFGGVAALFEGLELAIFIF